MTGLSTSGFPRNLLWLGIALGALTGVGAFTFNYAHGFSYLGSDPTTCMHCHIMRQQFDSWEKSSHHKVAVCTDCHLPNGFLSRYIAKGANGYHHSRAFTLQDFKEPITIKPQNSQTLQFNCLRCHEELMHAILHAEQTDKDAMSCVHCHPGVGHGEQAGLGGPDRGEIEERKTRQ